MQLAQRMQSVQAYRAEMYFLPLFGLMIWLLTSAIAASLLAFSQERSADFTQMLNVFGLSMLLPMPVVWGWDWLMIALGTYTLPVMAASQ